jgi:hypothetical protein
VKMARWVEEVMTGVERLGSGEGGMPMQPTPTPSASPAASELATLIAKLRTGVVPFVDDAEAARLKGLCADLEASSGESIDAAKDRLQAELRKYSYLL